MRLSVSSLLLLFVIATSCSSLTKEDPEKKVREFLASFNTTLQKSDEEIIKQFESKQSDYVILQVIKILQNRENGLIQANANFSAATISLGDEIKVDIPVTLVFDQKKAEDGAQAMLTLWLQLKNNTFVITKLGGETLYQEFTSLKNRNEWLVAENVALQERAADYATAANLEAQFDSVVWYSSYEGEIYFYAVHGSWSNYFMNYETRNNVPANVKMGLVNAQGEIIIPIEYDLVGTLGFDRPNTVEVTKDGKVGLFDIAQKRIFIDAVYDFIIPHPIDNALAVVKKDNQFGWINKDTVYVEGFASERMKSWVSTFEFLRKPVSLKSGNQSFCEIPRADHAGNGIVMPPSYYVSNGLFDKIESGISTTEIPMNGWTEYKETKGTVFERLSTSLNAVITTVRERYLEGREEFYTTNKLVFVDSKLDTLNVSAVSGESISISLIDSTLLEVRTPHDYWFAENGVSEESNLTNYNYFRIGESHRIEKLKSNRLFAQTEFVKLDSSYITGNFTTYNDQSEKNENRQILSLTTLTSMRNEILASYGYRFADPELLEKFKEYSWYTPLHDDIKAFENEMTEIDKHNLAFLDKVIVRLNSMLAMN